MAEDEKDDNAAEEMKKEEPGDDSEAEGGDDNAQEDGKEEEATQPSTPVDWPLRGIKEPHDNDVLYGRGGGTNHHPGNKRYRKMVEDRKLDYVNSKRLDKPLVALEIIREWRAQDPPGRFLKMDNEGLWNDVGDKKAREKTSQALREKAPQIRKQQEEERIQKEDKPSEKGEAKTTRFAEGTNTEAKPKSDLKKSVLARDHSLGRDFIKEDEPVTLEGFSWQDPFRSSSSMQDEIRRQDSGGSNYNSGGALPREHYPAPESGRHSGPSPTQGVPLYSPSPSSGTTHSVAPAGARYSEQTYAQGSSPPSSGYDYVGRSYSGEMPPPLAPPNYRISSQGSSGGPVPPTDYYTSAPEGEELVHRQSSGRYDTWTQQRYPYPTPHLPPQRSGSWSYGPAEAAPVRENSLSLNPLTNASVSQPAPRAAFDSTRSASGFWEDPNLPKRPAPAQHHYGPSSYRNSGSSPYSSRHKSPTREYNQTNGTGPIKTTDNNSPPYSVDPVIAQTWSGQSEEEISRAYDKRQIYRKERRVERHIYSDDDGMADNRLPRPHIVKRATSNQNETLETKKDLKGPSVKRAALNRDNSLAANTLKEKYLPEYYGENKHFEPEQEVNRLSHHFRETSIGGDFISSKPNPRAMKDEERSSTLNQIAMELMVKPVTLAEGGRSSTIDALNLALDDDSIIKEEAIDSSTMEAVVEDLKNTEKPKLNRLSTVDVTDMIKGPLDEDFTEDIF